MSIWNGEITTKILNDLNMDSLGGFFEIDFIEVGKDFLKAKQE